MVALQRDTDWSCHDGVMNVMHQSDFSAFLNYQPCPRRAPPRRTVFGPISGVGSPPHSFRHLDARTPLLLRRAAVVDVLAPGIALDTM